MKLRTIPLATIVTLIVCLGLTSCCFLGFIGSCKNGTDYCCLRYERGEPLAVYCSYHSGAVGIYMARLGSDSIGAVWLDDFQRFCGRIRGCGSPDCIEDSLRVATELAEFIADYTREHALAETGLAAHPEVSLSPTKKASLIRCGFSDAIERKKANLQRE